MKAWNNFAKVRCSENFVAPTTYYYYFCLFFFCRFFVCLLQLFVIKKKMFSKT